MRKDEVLQELLDRLAAMDIEPVGAIERIPSLVEKRVWRATNSAAARLEESSSDLFAESSGESVS